MCAHVCVYLPVVLVIVRLISNKYVFVPQATRRMEFQFEGLTPFTMYTIRVEARNQYTVGPMNGEFFEDNVYKTLPGGE